MCKKKREFSPKFLMTLTATADCVSLCQQLIPCLAENLNLARVCRKLKSWGCKVGCAIPDGMVTDVDVQFAMHINV